MQNFYCPFSSNDSQQSDEKRKEMQFYVMDNRKKNKIEEVNLFLGHVNIKWKC